MNPLQPIIEAVGEEAAEVILQMVAIAAEHLQRKHGRDLEDAPRAKLVTWCAEGVHCGATALQWDRRCCDHQLGKKGIG